MMTPVRIIPAVTGEVAGFLRPSLVADEVADVFAPLIIVAEVGSSAVCMPYFGMSLLSVVVAGRGLSCLVVRSPPYCGVTIVDCVGPMGDKEKPEPANGHALGLITSLVDEAEGHSLPLDANVGVRPWERVPLEMLLKFD